MKGIFFFQLKAQSKTETDFSQNAQQKCQETFCNIDQQKQSQHFLIMTPQQHPCDEWEALQKAELPSPHWSLQSAGLEPGPAETFQ